MKVQLKLFAQTKELLNAEMIDVELPTNATVADLKTTLVQSYPQLSSLAPHLLFALGNDYISDETPISTNSTLACFPPVSGG